MLSAFFHDDLLNAWPGQLHLAQRSRRNTDDVMRPIQPVMSMDLVESENAFSLYADLPGVDRADLDITIDHGVLTISAKKENHHEDKTATAHYIERSSGSVQRSIRLPKNVDTTDLKATFDKGVLQLTLPKQPEVKPAAIKVPIA